MERWTKTYNELTEYGAIRVPYAVQLLAKEWYNKRNLIIGREYNCCQICSERCADGHIPKTGRHGVYWAAAVVGEIEEYD